MVQYTFFQLGQYAGYDLHRRVIATIHALMSSRLDYSLHGAPFEDGMNIFKIILMGLNRYANIQPFMKSKTALNSL